MIFIALGANLPSKFGTPHETLNAAFARLNAEGIKVLAQSRIWKTAPVPISDQPWYHNAVAVVETELSVFELLAKLQNIENDFGRVRMVRNEARVLDLDIIDFKGQVYDHHNLILPHPRMHERAFVLLPLRDIAPDWAHPISQKNLNELIGFIPNDQLAEAI